MCSSDLEPRYVVHAGDGDGAADVDRREIRDRDVRVALEVPGDRERTALDLEVRVRAARARVEADAFGAQTLERGLAGAQLGRVAPPGLVRDHELEVALLRAQLLVAAGLGGLAVERRDRKSVV